MFPCVVRMQTWTSGPNGERRNIQEGSAVIVGDGRYLLTCRHNIGVNENIAVFRSGETKAMQLANPRRDISKRDDIAIVQTDSVLGKPALIGTETISPGHEVILTGYPLRWHHLVATVGNVSGYSDASFSLSIANTTGFSGGGVFNTAGRLIGIIAANQPILEKRTFPNAIEDDASRLFFQEHPSAARILEQIVVGIPVGLAFALFVPDIQNLLGSHANLLNHSGD